MADRIGIPATPYLAEWLGRSSTLLYPAFHHTKSTRAGNGPVMIQVRLVKYLRSGFTTHIGWHWLLATSAFSGRITACKQTVPPSTRVMKPLLIIKRTRTDFSVYDFHGSIFDFLI
jgi:hypothetical protein